MENGRSTNYWPGFVDALSNMVLAMIFVVLVLGLAMGMYATLAADAIAKRLMAEAEAARMLSAGGDRSADVPPRGTGQPRVDPTPEQAPAAKLRVQRAASAEPPDPARVRRQQNVIIIEFEGQTVALDEAAQAALGRALQPAGELLRTGQADIVARSPGGNLTESQHVSFYRAMAIRNILIERGMSPERITVRVPESDGADLPHGEVRIALRAGVREGAR
jgi:hypothetical protein